MESLGLYLLKSAVWLTGFTLVFLMVLRNERYFRLNRIYLLSGIVAAIVFPFYTWHYAVILPSVEVSYATTSGVSPVAMALPPTTIPIYWWFYLVGMVSIAFRLVWQTGMVVRKLRKTGYVKTGSVKLVRTSEYDGSFSFFSFVFVNPSIADIETKEIVNHEREHIQQKHWFDLLLVELLCMLQWFNPFVWIYARLIRQNHEYLADEMALQHTSNPAIYQATLLNQMLGAPVISLANSFSYSLNKKRFKMMKKKIDSPFRKLKVLLVLPLVAMVFYAFAKPEYITSAPAPSTEKITTIAEALNELKVPVALPVVKSDKVIQVEKDKIVKGKVVNPDGKPLAGTTVIIKGTTIGTITDNNGGFELKDVPKDGELVFSFVGYATAKEKADFEKAMVIEMAKQNVGIDGVVVTGYGPKPPAKADAGSNADEIINSSNNPPALYILDGVIIDPANMNFKREDVESIDVLKGKSGTELYGEKGKNGVVLITLKKDQGQSTSGTSGSDGNSNKANNVNLNLDSNLENPPLYILDGVIIERTKMDEIINPENIESISVLKDKSATAMYGDKGKNGAVLITSKGKANAANGKKDGDLKVVGYGKSGDYKPYDPALISHQGVAIRSTDPQNPPLYVLNGEIADKTVIDALNPIDIASIYVLKDKSATDRYGDKGKNGILWITSKGKATAYADQKVDKPTKSDSKDKELFTVVEEMPEFPGGALALRKLIAQSVKYPVEAQKGGIVGKVFVTFVVNSNGKVENAKIARGIHPALDKEALRVVNSLPDWKPGQQHGEAVDVAYTMPIEFKLQ